MGLIKMFYSILRYSFVVCMSDPQCLNASNLLSSHGMSQNGGISASDFSILCPALLHQIEGGACINHRNAEGHGQRG